MFWFGIYVGGMICAAGFVGFDRQHPAMWLLCVLAWPVLVFVDLEGKG